MKYDTNTRIEECEIIGDALDDFYAESQFAMTLEQAFEEGIDTHAYAALIDEMYWDGHSLFDIKQQIQVLEGDTSI